MSASDLQHESTISIHMYPSTSNLAGEAGDYIRTRISDDPHLGKGAGVFISQIVIGAAPKGP